MTKLLIYLQKLHIPEESNFQYTCCHQCSENMYIAVGDFLLESDE